MDEEFDIQSFIDKLRQSASIKAGAVIFGEAQVAYYNVLKEHMEEELAFNMLAHTTEIVIKALASAAGPVMAVFVHSVERRGEVSESENDG